MDRDVLEAPDDAAEPTDPAPGPADGGGHDEGNDDDDHDGGDDDDVIVLSWWQHPANVIALIVATALIAGMIGWLIVDANDDDSGNAVDIGFLQDMRIHHEQAVEMAFTYLSLPDTDASLQTVARSILYGQSIDIGRMIQMLRGMGAPEAAETDEAMAWMGMPTTHDQMDGMATQEQLNELANASGTDADRLFVELMVAHHQGGVHMAEAAVDAGDNAEVRAMAESFIKGQQGEIAELEMLAPT
ncbi:MAG: DUF305 domain-containing protein [Ilumatobacteraceae bacterium]